jgi:hypothetical protein
MNAVELRQEIDDLTPLLESAEAILGCPCRRGKCTAFDMCEGHSNLWKKSNRHAHMRNAQERRVLQLMVACLQAQPHSRQEIILSVLVSAQFARDYDSAERIWGKACRMVFGMDWKAE